MSIICARSLGVVLQENFLFRGTIRETIAAAKPRCELRGDRAGGAARRRRGVHRAAAARLRDLHLGGLDQPVGRPASAARDRPRADRRSAHPDPRRGDERARCGQRGDRQRQPDAASRKGRTLIVISHRLSSLVQRGRDPRARSAAPCTTAARTRNCSSAATSTAGLWHQQHRHLNHQGRSNEIIPFRPNAAAVMRRPTRSSACFNRKRRRSSRRPSRSGSAPRLYIAGGAVRRPRLLVAITRLDRVVDERRGRDRHVRADRGAASARPRRSSRRSMCATASGSRPATCWRRSTRPSPSADVDALQAAGRESRRADRARRGRTGQTAVYAAADLRRRGRALRRAAEGTITRSARRSTTSRCARTTRRSRSTRRRSPS